MSERLASRGALSLGFGVGLGFGAGLVLGLLLGARIGATIYNLPRIERNFARVKPGMSSGQALKTIFENVLVFPDGERGAKVEKWSVWGYDLVKMIKARAGGSYPFTLTVDLAADRVVSAQYEYNTRFD